MAAVPQHSPSPGKNSDLVAQDMIWKAHVKKELETSKSWPENWGFLTTSYNESRNENIMEAKETAQKIKVPDHMKVRMVTPMEQYIKILTFFQVSIVEVEESTKDLAVISLTDLVLYDATISVLKKGLHGHCPDVKTFEVSALCTQRGAILRGFQETWDSRF